MLRALIRLFAPARTSTAVPVPGARLSSVGVATSALHTLSLRGYHHRQYPLLSRSISRGDTKRSMATTTHGAAAAAVQKVDTTSRLTRLRELMGKPENDVTAYVIPSEDQRAYISISLSFVG